MTTENYIGIGFDKPKYYKPHVWRKAKAIMEWLCDNTPHVERVNLGRGNGKYMTRGAWDKLDLWKEVVPGLAKIYDEKVDIVILSFTKDVEIPTVDLDQNEGWKQRKFTKGEILFVIPCETTENGACFGLGSIYIECIPWDAFLLNGVSSHYKPGQS